MSLETKFNRLPLHIAAKANDSTALAALLVDPAVHALINERTTHGHTALFLAAQMGHANVVQALHRQAQADLNLPDNGGLAPLHIAARNGHLPVLHTLLSLGADPSQLDNIQWTPLHWALKNGHDDCTALLKTTVSPDIQAQAFKMWKK